MNEKPTENKERRQIDNTPIGLDVAEKTSSKTSQKSGGAGFGLPMAFVIVGLICISVLGLIWVTFYLDYPVRTPTPTQDWSATRNAWVKPDESPTFGSKEDANNANSTAGESLSLEFLAIKLPVIPDVIQPGEVFIYNIFLEKSEPRLWRHGWCAMSQNLLETNFSQMKIEFIANESPVPTSLLHIQDEANDDGSACRSYNALILDWPQGVHLLESHITFTKPTDDGWNLYPAGTHIFQYIVTVDQDGKSSLTGDVKSTQTAVAEAARKWEVQLFDTFDNNTNQWQEGTFEDANATVSYDITDGKYRWVVVANSETDSRSLIIEESYDFYLSVDIQRFGETGGDMGVIFRKDDKGNYYYFALGTISDGSCSLLKFYEGEWETLIPWGYCPSVIPNKPNKLTIIATGNHIITLINDRVVGDTNNDAIQGNKIEFAVRVYYPDTGIYEFDNLELRLPSP